MPTFDMGAAMAAAHWTAVSPRQWNTTDPRRSDGTSHLTRAALRVRPRRLTYGTSRTASAGALRLNSRMRRRTAGRNATRAGSRNSTMTRAGRSVPMVCACSTMCPTTWGMIRSLVVSPATTCTSVYDMARRSAGISRCATDGLAVAIALGDRLGALIAQDVVDHVFQRALGLESDQFLGAREIG